MLILHDAKYQRFYQKSHALAVSVYSQRLPNTPLYEISGVARALNALAHVAQYASHGNATQIVIKHRTFNPLILGEQKC